MVELHKNHLNISITVGDANEEYVKMRLALLRLIQQSCKDPDFPPDGEAIYYACELLQEMELNEAQIKQALA